MDDALPPGGSLRGVLPPRPRLAIVGSRAAHRPYRAAVADAVTAIAKLGWSLVSGGALGIDGDAHRAALARGVPQLVVLPCGADRVYPPAHATLFDEIASRPDSGLVFAHPPGTDSARGMFVSRNRHVVALADAVLVAEAARRSGTVTTGRMALKAKRPVAAFVGTPGAAVLVAEGATALALEDGRVTDKVAAWLRGDVGAATAWPSALQPLREALDEFGPLGVPAAELTRRGLAAALLTAELAGLVVEASPGRWRIA